MTGSSCVHPGSSTLRRLLATMKMPSCAEDTAVDAMSLNWRSPRCFNEEQYNRLAAVMSQVAAVIGTGLARHFNSEVTVAPSSITLHFAAGLNDLGIYGKGYCLPFGPPKAAPCGFVSLTSEAALGWVERLLGDSGSDEDAGRPLASLEESLLGDVVVGVVEAFLAPLQPHQNLCPGDHLIQGDPGIEFEPTQEVCTILFTISSGEANENDGVLFVAPCSLLAPLVGKAPRAVQQISPEELSRTLMEHIQHIPIMVTARLASTRLSFENLLGLDRDDILLLDKAVDTPVELLVGNRVIFRGRPVRADGRRAVLVTESAGNPTQKSSKGPTVN